MSKMLYMHTYKFISYHIILHCQSYHIYKLSPHPVMVDTRLDGHRQTPTSRPPPGVRSLGHTEVGDLDELHVAAH